MIARSTVLVLSAAWRRATPRNGSAQTPPPQPQDSAATELVFEREIFDYPVLQRRNPFRALAAGTQGGPRLGQIRLIGILYSDRPSESVAVLGTSQPTVSEDGLSVSLLPGESWYLKVGQSVGNIRVIEIGRSQVVVEVIEFGLTEQQIMQLDTRRLGGPR